MYIFIFHEDVQFLSSSKVIYGMVSWGSRPTGVIGIIGTTLGR